MFVDSCLFLFMMSCAIQFTLHSVMIDSSNFAIALVFVFVSGIIINSLFYLEGFSFLFLSRNLICHITIPITILKEYFSMERYAYLTTRTLFYVGVVVVLGFLIEVLLVAVVIHTLLSGYIGWDLELTTAFAVMCCLPASDQLISDLNARCSYPHLRITSILQVEVVVSFLAGVIIFLFITGQTHVELKKGIFVYYNETWIGLNILFVALFVFISMFLLYIIVFYVRSLFEDAVIASILVVLFGCAIYVFLSYFCTSIGLIIVVIYAHIVSTVQITKNSESELHVSFLCELLSVIIRTFLIVYCAIFVATNPEYVTITGIGVVAVGFLLSFCARFAVYSVHIPFLLKLNLWSAVDNIFASSALPHRSLMTILLSMMYCKRNFRHGQQLITYGLLLIVQSTFLSVAVRSIILKFSLTFTPNSPGHITTILFLDDLQKTVNIGIQSLKYNTLFSYCDWKLIMELFSPVKYYNKFLMNYGLFFLNKHNKQLIDYKKPFEQQFFSIRNRKNYITHLEIKQRILKKQIDYCRILFYEGYINHDDLDLLISIMLKAMETDCAGIDVKELDCFRISFKIFNGMIGFMYRVLSYFPQKDQVFVKHDITNAKQLHYYYLRYKLKYKLTFAFLSLIDIVLIAIVGGHDIYSIKVNAIDKFTFQKIVLALGTISFFFFVYECFFQLRAFRFKRFFATLNPKMDFIAIWIIKSHDFVFLVYLYISKMRHTGDFITFDDLTHYQKSYRMMTIIMRLHRCYPVIEAFCEGIRYSLQCYLNKMTSRAVIICQAYDQILDKTIRTLDCITNDQKIYNCIRKEIESDRKKLYRIISRLEKRQSIVIFSQRASCCSYIRVVNHFEQNIGELIECGVIQPCNSLYQISVFQKYQQVMKNSVILTDKGPEPYLNKISWLYGEQESISVLKEDIKHYSYASGDYLIRKGDDSLGMYILIAGEVRAKYVPSETTVLDWKKEGIIPNSDFFINLCLEYTSETKVPVGSVIGELGLCTGRKSDMIVECVSAAEVYYISFSTAKEIAFYRRNSKDLRMKIWKVIAMKIAALLVTFLPFYLKFEKEDIDEYFSGGFVPYLVGLSVLDLGDMVVDVILIQGIIKDPITNDVYVAPFCIPRFVRVLYLPNSMAWERECLCEVILLLVPAPGLEECEIMTLRGIIREKWESRSNQLPLRESKNEMITLGKEETKHQKTINTNEKSCKIHLLTESYIFKQFSEIFNKYEGPVLASEETVKLFHKYISSEHKFIKSGFNKTFDPEFLDFQRQTIDHNVEAMLASAELKFQLLQNMGCVCIQTAENDKIEDTNVPEALYNVQLVRSLNDRKKSGSPFGVRLSNIKNLFTNNENWSSSSLVTPKASCSIEQCSSTSITIDTEDSLLLDLGTSESGSTFSEPVVPERVPFYLKCVGDLGEMVGFDRIPFRFLGLFFPEGMPKN